LNITPAKQINLTRTGNVAQSPPDRQSVGSGSIVNQAPPAVCSRKARKLRWQMKRWTRSLEVF
jgi:hypothetical protein